MKRARPPSPDPPLRVALFTEAYSPIVSGVTVATRALVDGLRARGHVVDVFTPRHPDQPAHEPGTRRLPSLFLPVPGWIPLSLPLTSKVLGRIASGAHYNVVHAQHPFTLGRAARALARRQNAPLVATIHTQYEQYVHYWSLWPTPARALVRRLLRQFCDSCDGVTTVAGGMADILRSYGVRPDLPVAVIPNTLGNAQALLSADGAGVREELGFCANDTLLLSVSRLAREKNLLFLLDALAPLLAAGAGPPLRLVLAGDGPLRPVLERRARVLGLPPQCVRFLGTVPHEQTPRLYAAADLFLLSSVSEVNPLVLREALAAGTPVVAVDSFAARAVIADGLDGVMTPCDAAAFGAVVADLCRPGARAAMGAHAREFARRRETGDDPVEQTLALYHRLLAARHAGEKQ